MESRKTVELCSKLYKTKEEQQIFLGFSIRTRTKANKQAKQNIFGFFEFWKDEIKTAITKRRKEEHKSMNVQRTDLI